MKTTTQSQVPIYLETWHHDWENGAIVNQEGKSVAYLPGTLASGYRYDVAKLLGQAPALMAIAVAAKAYFESGRGNGIADPIWHEAKKALDAINV